MLLEIENLSVSFVKDGQLRPVVKEVTLAVAAGEIVGVVGESGSGKSVTVQAVMGLLPKGVAQVSGSVRLEGRELLDLSNKQMQNVRGQRIGMVFQDPMRALNPTMTIGQQIAEAMVWHCRIGWQEARQRAIALLDQVRISDAVRRYDAYPFQLSGGMRQRVVIAMALACDPALLIADEPTTALDVTIQAQIIRLLEDLCRERQMGLLFITHDLAVASNLCSRIAVMYRGQVVESGTAEALFTNPQHTYTRELVFS